MSSGLRVVVTGAAGQLGQALQASVPQGIELIALRRQELDLADAKACTSLVRGLAPVWVLYAGAYTAVDKAESEPELAHAVNGGAPHAFAEFAPHIAEHSPRGSRLTLRRVHAGRAGRPGL